MRRVPARVYTGREMRALTSIALLLTLLSLAGAQVKTDTTLPADVNPETRSRFPPVRREDMKEGSRKYFDAQPAGGTPVLQRGPQHLYLYSPALAETMGRFNAAIREEGVINTRFSEIAIMVVARETDQKFVWAAHETAGIRAGVEQPIIDAIKFDKSSNALAGVPEKEAVLIRYARQLLREHKVSPDLFAKAVDSFGRQGVIELTAMMGHYMAIGLLLDAADQQLQPGTTALLPSR
jgi:4-carboxymuconolactone decarboxylase